ncbi:Alkaline nuclease [Frankliniella fusca]|uniref:Alkaline nuclease n=1 Tax=Frankliniella fusca TaxID=407009 RepID=A0AAE1LMR0_9NEOP|nr:Alkaline nuclease [Frankliniella fusca]
MGGEDIASKRDSAHQIEVKLTKPFSAAVTTTGTHCYWRKSGNPKNPGLVREKQYETKKPLGPRINFDPRPTAYKTDGISDAQLREFKENLQQSTPTCLFLYHLDSGFIPSTVMDSEVILDLDTDEGCMMLADNCSKLLWMLARKCLGKSGPFEVANTRGQHTSKVWHAERVLCVNPSSAKTFLQLKKEITIIRWLRKKIWHYGNFENEAMRTGKRLESVARKRCETILKEEQNPKYCITETGLWKNPKYPQLACSPDGIITLQGEKNKLLEIKVLTMLHKISESDQEIYNLEEEDNPDPDDSTDKRKKLKPINPEKFEDEMTPKQKRSFYLKRNEEGCIKLKPTHAYNYQIQMSLDILELEECILCVYSETGCILVTVQYDQEFWEEKRYRLIQKHREMIIPEVILGRTKRWLPPCQLVYSCFHEDPHDDYFEDNNHAED